MYCFGPCKWLTRWLLSSGYSDPYCLLGLMRRTDETATRLAEGSAEECSTVLSPVALMAGIIGDVRFFNVSAHRPSAAALPFARTRANRARSSSSSSRTLDRPSPLTLSLYLSLDQYLPSIFTTAPSSCVYKRPLRQAPVSITPLARSLLDDSPPT